MERDRCLAGLGCSRPEDHRLRASPPSSGLSGSRLKRTIAIQPRSRVAKRPISVGAARSKSLFNPKDNGVPNPTLPPRLAAMIRIALLPADASVEDIARSERLARAAGVTGAEIDAARQGRSFDVRASGAIAFALAIVSEDPARIDQDRLRARAVGLKAADIRALERETLRLLQGTGGS
jgi:hypothetical protein